jgi:D-sedoheptulose 7-phosphate isomerase
MIERNDIVIGISTNGNSMNVVNALQLAKHYQATTIGMLGAHGGKVKDIVDMYILAPGQNIEQEEDAHMILAHIITRYMRAFIHTLYHEKLKNIHHEEEHIPQNSIEQMVLVTETKR